MPYLTETELSNLHNSYRDLERKADKLVEACKIALEFFVQLDLRTKAISGLSLQLNEALKEKVK